MHPAIEIEELETWPTRVTDLLKSSLALLEAYEQEQQRIDSLREQDFLAYETEPGTSYNHYRVERQSKIEKVTELLTEENIIGFHACRLHDREIEQVKAEGLLPLSSDLLQSRITALVKSGEITPAIASKLLQNNETGKSGREGKVWFVNSRSLLTAGGLERQWRSWGGESLYNSHERDEETGRILQSIGKPCIVKSSLTVKQYFSIQEIGFYFVSAYLNNFGIRQENNVQLEGYSKSIVAPERIIRIIEDGDPEFLQLTKS